MAEREKVKRKALHRGLDDIINRDASLTSRLLGRVQPVSREPLSLTQEGAAVDALAGLLAATNETVSEEISDQGRKPHRPRPSGKGLRKVGGSESPGSLNGQEHISTREEGRGNLRSLLEPGQGVQVAAPLRVRGDVAERPAAIPATVSDVMSFEEFEAHWGLMLRSGGRAGKLRICEVLYKNTYTLGVETFFTSYEKLAKLTQLAKKQCSINIKQLENLGFVERVNIFNTATRQGTEFRLHLNPLPPSARQTPPYHCYDEDLR
jgi:hypothetical protein